MTLQRALSVHDLQQDQAQRVVLGDVPIAIVLDGEGTIHAIGDTCTHGEISLSEGFVDKGEIECWAHGSAFSLTTGKPRNLPAYEPVPVFNVVIQNDDVYIDPTTPKEITA